MARRTLDVRVTGDATGAQAAFAKTEAEASTMSARLSKKFGALGKRISTGASLAAGVGLAAGIRAAWTSAEESERIGRATANVIRSTGGAAGLTAKQVANLATATSRKTGIDDEAIQAGQNMLLTFKNIGRKVFPDTTRAVLDMATTMNKGALPSMDQIAATSMAVGKALNDPIKGLGKLGRQGVTFTDQQKEQIRVMQESGDIAGAQKVILQELATEFGGAAKAAATPFDKLKVSLGNIAEDLGSTLIPIVRDTLVPALAKAGVWFGKLSAPVKKTAVVGAILLAALVALAPAFAAIGAVIGVVASPVFLIIAGLVALGVAVYLLWTNWDQVWNWIKDHPAIAAVTALFFPFIAMIVATVGAVKYVYDNWDTLWTGMQQIAATVWASIGPVVMAGVDVIVGVVRFAMAILRGDWSAAWEAVKQVVSGAWSFIVNGAQLAISTTVQVFGALSSRITGAIGDLAGRLFNSGIQLVQGIVNGILSQGGRIAGAIKSLIPGGGLIGKAASVLGFASGGRPPVGVASIVGERGPELFVPDRGGTIIPNGGFGGGASGGSSIVVQVVVHGSVSTERDLVQAVRDGLIKLVRTTPGAVLPGVTG